MRRKLLSFLTALMLLLTGCDALPVISAASAMTRIEWISMLTDALELQPPEDLLDQYFFDVVPSHPDYIKAQAAAWYNALTPEAEYGMLYPDEPADREFVAVTTARILGYVSAPEQEISDLGDCREPDMVNIAVASGLFPLNKGGSFDPSGMADNAFAEAAIAAAKADSMPAGLDPDHVDSYELDPAVVDLQFLPGVSWTDKEVLTFEAPASQAGEFRAGEVVLMPGGGVYDLGIARKIESVELNGDLAVIHTSQPMMDEIFEYIDIQEQITIPIEPMTEVSAAGDDPALRKLLSDGITAVMPLAGTDTISTSIQKSLSLAYDPFTGTADIGNLTITMVITDDFRFDKMLESLYYIKLDYNLGLEFGIKGKMLGKSQNFPFDLPSPIPTSVPGLTIDGGGIEVNFNIEAALSAGINLSGSYAYTITENNCVRVPADKENTTDYKLSGSLSGTLSLEPYVTIGFIGFHLFRSGIVYAVDGEGKITYYLGEEGGYCVDLNAGFRLSLALQLRKPGWSFLFDKEKISVDLSPGDEGSGKKPLRFEATVYKTPIKSWCFEGSAMDNLMQVDTCTHGFELTAAPLQLSVDATGDVVFQLYNGESKPIAPIGFRIESVTQPSNATVTISNNAAYVTGTEDGTDSFEINGKLKVGEEKDIDNNTIGETVIDKTVTVRVMVADGQEDRPEPPAASDPPPEAAPPTVSDVEPINQFEYYFNVAPDSPEPGSGLLEKRIAGLTRYFGDKTELKIPDFADTAAIDGGAGRFEAEAPIVSIADTCFRPGLVTEIAIPQTVTYFAWGGSGPVFYEDSGIPNLDAGLDPAWSGAENPYFVGDFQIPYGVTCVSRDTFLDCDRLTSVLIPQTVTETQDNVFRGSSIESVSIPGSVTTLGDNLFTDCLSLERVDIGDGITQTGSMMFSGNEALRSVTLPDSLELISQSAFNRCASLPNIILPENLREIGDNAFSGCTSLEEIEIPQNVEILGANVFMDCTSLKRVSIAGNSVTTGRNAFFGCTSLTEAELPDGLMEISDNMFGNCTSLERIVIPEGVTSIGERAFEACFNLREVVIPDSVTEIGANAFSACRSLSEETRARIDEINR